jgi:hypothetical protein
LSSKARVGWRSAISIRCAPRTVRGQRPGESARPERRAQSRGRVRMTGTDSVLERRTPLLNAIGSSLRLAVEASSWARMLPPPRR